MPLINEFTAKTGVSGILDLQTGFSYESAYQQIGNYGEEGIQIYNYIQIVDTIFPIAFGMGLLCFLSFLLKKLSPDNKKLTTLALLPLIGTLFDFLENIGIFLMIRLYPQPFTTLAGGVKVIGIIKMIGYGFGFTGISIVLILLFIRWIKKKVSS
jgi:hypothetical protein